jgi:hypothetical protein
MHHRAPHEKSSSLVCFAQVQTCTDRTRMPAYNIQHAKQVIFCARHEQQKYMVATSPSRGSFSSSQVSLPSPSNTLSENSPKPRGSTSPVRMLRRDGSPVRQAVRPISPTRQTAGPLSSAMPQASAGSSQQNGESFFLSWYLPVVSRRGQHHLSSQWQHLFVCLCVCVFVCL